MISQALRFAAILSVFIGIANITSFECDLMESNTGKNFAGAFSLISMVAGLFFGMRAIRVNVYKNEQTYGQAFYGGIVIALFTSIGAAFFTLVYLQFYRPNYNQLLIPVVEKTMKKFGAGAKEIAEEIAKYQNANVSGAFISTFFLTLFFMFIISAIMAAFVRTKDTFNTDSEFQ